MNSIPIEFKPFHQKYSRLRITKYVIYNEVDKPTVNQ